jgi:hypothetical protein
MKGLRPQWQTSGVSEATGKAPFGKAERQRESESLQSAFAPVAIHNWFWT